MAIALVKFQDFVEQLGLKEHDLNVDQLNMALTNTLPVNTQTVFDDVTNHAQPAAVNGYTLNGYDITNTWAEVTGTATLDGASTITVTATAGGIGPFQYIVLYNFGNATDMLICYYDHGSAVTLADGEDFVITITTNIFTLV